MFTRIHSAALNGLNAFIVQVELNAIHRLTADDQTPRFFMVGLPDNAVKESRMRVMSALGNCMYQSDDLIVTINLAPADIRKEGSGLDLPIAIGMMQFAGRVKEEQLDDMLFVGELGLDGSIRSVRGTLPIALEARRNGYHTLFVPKDNAKEASVVNEIEVIGVSHLQQVLDHLNGINILPSEQCDTQHIFNEAQSTDILDFADVKGQDMAKRAFEVAAAGGHNIMLIGSPGCGKSMMAKRMSSILPRLTLQEALETTRIYSIAGKLGKNSALITRRPFRSPHHTISDVALIGGGANLQPGEISLAHNGVLFLDEMPEFSRSGLETLRQPLEDREITISRTKYTATLPCSFTLVAAMNPCPCGYYNDPTRHCSCTQAQIQRYMSRISGPLLDRIDIQVEVTPVPILQLRDAPRGESSSDIRARVLAARHIQTERYNNLPHIHCNAQMGNKELERYVSLDDSANEALTMAMQNLHLSARAFTRILKMARTIADLAGREKVDFFDISEAVGYRTLDKPRWGESF